MLSGRTEFRSSALEAAGNFVVPLFRGSSATSSSPAGPCSHPIPHSRGAPRRGASLTRSAFSPRSPTPRHQLQRAGDQAMQKRIQGEQTVTTDPVDAEDDGIADGADVAGVDDRGRFVALAHLSDEVAPGWWCAPWVVGENAKDGRTVNAAQPVAFADLGATRRPSPTRGSRWPRPSTATSGRGGG